ncbi:LamG domain-containing protein [Patescibacteria group bacterium]|nr:LamG domain-containing protein [Patescibacteria group bacterium]MBU1123550.1 LamG domain-containing protein [Patescibacteria group bacterium]MBU1911601.1 LamG domain-containing protein [Patescibacteria group bacterium]
MKRYHSSQGFTLLEILIVMVILIILFGLIFVKLRPIKHKGQAYDIERMAEVKSIESGVTQYIIDNLSLPSGTPIGDASVAKDICQESVTGASCTGSPVNGVDLSSLVPVFLQTIPVDPAATGSIVTGYKFYSDGEDVYAIAPLISALPSYTPPTGDDDEGEDESGCAGSLIAYWKLDETTGTSSTDECGGTHNGTLLNGATWMSGLFDNAIKLDGSNDSINIPTHSDFNSLNSFTTSAWILPYTLNDSRIIQNDALEMTFYSDGRVRFSIAGILGNYYSISKLPVNHWSHVAIDYDGSNVKLYINGALDISLVASGTTSSDAGDLNIGSTGSSNYFSGKIDDVRFYNSSISASEIGTLAAAGFDGSLVAYWKLDEGSGNTSADSSGSTNEHFLTLYNNPTWEASSTPPTNYSNPYSINLDGSNDYGRVASHNDFTFPEGFSVSLWAYLDTSMPYGGGLVGSQHFYYQGWMIYTYNNSVRVYINNELKGNTSISSAEWKLITLVWDGSNVKLYINSTLTNDTVYGTAPNSGGDSIIIGGMYSSGSDTGGNPSSFFNDKIDDIKIFNRPLSFAEVQRIASGNPLP